MAVEIYVSSEELKKTLEYVALIGGNMASCKKQDDDLKQMAGALRIVAVSPHKDNNYMLMFCRAGATEQLTYRMEGISNGCGQSADICVECKRFLALAKTFTGDVRLIFAEKELQIVVESSQYNLTILSARLPDLKIPEGGVCLSTGFLQEAMKHCSAAIAKDAVGARGGIEINIADDGSAVCWSAQNSCVAKYVVPPACCNQAVKLILLPLNIQHIAELAELGEVRLVSSAQGIFVTAPRFDYMCQSVSGSFPDCKKVAASNSETKCITINKSKLLAAISRASVIVGDEIGSKIKICSDTERLYIEAVSIAGTGIESIALDAAIGQDEDTNYFSAGRLYRLIYNCRGDSVTIGSNGKYKPIFVRATGSDSFYIVASMKG